MDERSWVGLLERAVNEPGKISEAYQQFHGYSIGNQFLALIQCVERGIEPGPIAAYGKWQKMGRQVRRGEKALYLWMPLTGRSKDVEDGKEVERTWTYFKLLPKWFVLAQTDGEAMPEVKVPGWDRAKALDCLEITERRFDLVDGNVQGFASKRSIAVNPVAAMPAKTTFHETAHVLLGHTGEGDMTDGAHIPMSLVEAEAECVALICCEALGLGGSDEARGYVQHWWGQGNAIPETSARRIFSAAQKILEAGR